MKLYEYLKALNKLSEVELEKALEYFRREEFKKGDYYLKEGQYANKISFIDSGLFRLVQAVLPARRRRKNYAVFFRQAVYD